MDAAAETSSLRERRAQQTRWEIRQAALRLFDEQGFATTTVEQIAAAAGVAPRTFFRYFPTKSDVVFDDHNRAANRLRDLLATAAPDTPLRQIRAAMITLQFQENTDPSGARIVARLLGTEPALLARNEELAAELERVVADHLVQHDGLEAQPAHLVSGALFGALRAARRLAETSDASPADLVEAVYALVERLLDEARRP